MNVRVPAAADILRERELLLHYHGRIERVATAVTFKKFPAERFGLTGDSSGHLALALKSGSAAERLGVRRGDSIILHEGDRD